VSVGTAGWLPLAVGGSPREGCRSCVGRLNRRHRRSTVADSWREHHAPRSTASAAGIAQPEVRPWESFYRSWCWPRWWPPCSI